MQRAGEDAVAFFAATSPVRRTVVGHFHDVDFAAEPGGTCRRVDKRHKRPVAGATGLGAKLGHYSAVIDLLRAPPYHSSWGVCCYGPRLPLQAE